MSRKGWIRPFEWCLKQSKHHDCSLKVVELNLVAKASDTSVPVLKAQAFGEKGSVGGGGRRGADTGKVKQDAKLYSREVKLRSWRSNYKQITVRLQPIIWIMFMTYATIILIFIHSKFIPFVSEIEENNVRKSPWK